MMMNNTSASFEKVIDCFNTFENFLVVTHENPDGDAIGSAFALLHYLHAKGKSVEAFFPEKLPEKYLDFVSCDCRTELKPGELVGFDCVVFLDVPNLQRAALSQHLEQVVLPSETINIDHHPDNLLFARWNLVVSEAAATADILFQLFEKDEKFTITPDIANLLLLGLVMDTGGFRFDNTTPAVFNHAARLLELKANYHHIIKQMFFSNPLPQQQFQAELELNHLQLACNGRFAWFFVPPDLVEKYGVNMRNTEGLIESLRAIRGTEIVAILQPCEHGFKVSLRSKSHKYSVRVIARKLNGGGHELAAGGLIKTTSLETAQKILQTHVERELYALQP